MSCARATEYGERLDFGRMSVNGDSLCPECTLRGQDQPRKTLDSRFLGDLPAGWDGRCESIEPRKSRKSRNGRARTSRRSSFSSGRTSSISRNEDLPELHLEKRNSDPSDGDAQEDSRDFDYS
ncbi:hypothetical protein KM043_016325 [Ampulex compressa]|nr:hypothetical protein KM043_016325 [Ampulex compressa]